MFDKKDWLIISSKYKPKNQNLEETIFSLGNGYIASRGVLEEKPKHCCPGTFFAGIYDKVGSRVEELINFPEPFNFKIITFCGEKLDVSTCKVVSHKRTLDLRKGLLLRRTLFKTAISGRILYESLRFISKKDPHLAIEQVSVLPLDKKTDFAVDSSIDIGVYNKGLISEGRKRHFNIYEGEENKHYTYFSFQTLDKKFLVGYSQQILIKRGNHTLIRGENLFKISLYKNEKVFIAKILSFYTSRETKKKELKKKTLGKIKQSSKKGLSFLLKEHRKEWEKIWDMVDIGIKGEKKIVPVVRLNLYHLLINAPCVFCDSSIGARGLCEGYRGHIFWDTEIFVLPFFIYTNPCLAKNLLLYRYARLNQCKQQGREKGFKGAMFAWESADSGFDQTPPWIKTPQGKIVNVFTGKYEHHISADIAYAFYNYFRITNDLPFLLNYGLEVILETGKFWISRLIFNKKKKKYEILKVIPPDEIHQKVDNSFFTNFMAKFNIELAVFLTEKFRKTNPDEVNKILARCKIKEKDLNKWREMAVNIYLPSKNGIFEEFEGYFTKKDILTADNKFPHILPKNVSLESTRMVKQADVILLFLLSPFKFSFKQKKKNFDFYEKRTWHLSSLSPSVHSIIASMLGCVGDKNYKKKAYDYFIKSAFLDLQNIYGNTNEGIHIGNAGGLWQAIIFGFAGIKILNNILVVDPSLPLKWKKISFRIRYRGRKIKFEISQKRIKVFLEQGREIKIRIGSQVYNLKKVLNVVKYKYDFHLLSNIQRQRTQKD